MDVLFFQLTHLGAKQIDVLVWVSFPGLQRIILKQKLLQFVCRIEVRLLGLGKKERAGSAKRVPRRTNASTHIWNEWWFKLLILEGVPVNLRREPWVLFRILEPGTIWLTPQSPRRVPLQELFTTFRQMFRGSYKAD